MTDEPVVDRIAAAQGAGADLQRALGQLAMYGVTITCDHFGRVVVYASVADTRRLVDMLA